MFSHFDWKKKLLIVARCVKARQGILKWAQTHRFVPSLFSHIHWHVQLKIVCFGIVSGLLFFLLSISMWIKFVFLPSFIDHFDNLCYFSAFCYCHCLTALGFLLFGCETKMLFSFHQEKCQRRDDKIEKKRKTENKSVKSWSMHWIQWDFVSKNEENKCFRKTKIINLFLF